MKLLLSGLILCTSFIASAQLSMGYQEVQSTANCDNALEQCTYISKKPPTILVAHVNKKLFEDKPLRGVGKTLYAAPELEQTVYYWHPDQNLREAIFNSLVYFDQYEDFFARRIIEVTTTVYELSETAVNEIGYDILGVNIGKSLSSGLQGQTFEAVDTGTKIGLHMVTADIQGIIAAQRQKGRVEYTNSFTREVFNMESIGARHAAPVFNSPGSSINYETMQEGLSIGGNVSYIENKGGVLIKGLSVNYGVENDKYENTVTSLNIDPTDVFITDGGTVEIMGAKSLGKKKVRRLGLLTNRIENVEENIKLLIYVSAKSYTYEEHIEKQANLMKVNTPEFFTENEKEDLKAECVNSKNVLEDISLIAERGVNGEPALYILLDRENACKTNISDYIEIKVLGSKIFNQQFGSRSLENLMLRPFRLKEIVASLASDKNLDFKIKLKNERTGKSVTHKVRFSHKLGSLKGQFRKR